MADAARSSDLRQGSLDSVAQIYADCSSDATRKARDLLLVVSATLFFSALGLVTFNSELIKLPLLDLSVTPIRGLRVVLAALCSYLLVVHSARSYAEWTVWRLRRDGTLTTVLARVVQLLSDSADCARSASAAFHAAFQDSRRWMELKGDPPELIEAARRVQALHEEADRLMRQAMEREEELTRTQFENELAAAHERTEEGLRLSADIARQRREREVSLRPELERVEREMQEHHRLQEVSATRAKEAREEVQHIEMLFEPAKLIISLRVGLDILFPTAFAIAAIVNGLLAK